MNFKESKTKENLMRAFAGECQARTRYDFAAGIARGQKNYVVEGIFTFTANQEKEHAEVFYNHLKNENSETVEITAGYPVNLSNDLCELLAAAVHNETEEYEDAYRSFGQTAKEEGFSEIAQSFLQIAEIEKSHAARFEKVLGLLREDKLFVSDVRCGWMCLNCGNVLESEEAPPVCPVCQHERGYFIRLTLAPYTEG